MPRFKPIHKGLKLLPVDFERQVLPGTFEHALCHLVDHELDLAPFHARFKNDGEGAPAYDPAVLIKIVLLAYSRPARFVRIDRDLLAEHHDVSEYAQPGPLPRPFAAWRAVPGF